MSEAAFFIGLISGTSRDGVDAALIRFDGQRPDILAALCLPYPPALKTDLEQALTAGRRPSTRDLDRLDPLLAAHFAESAAAVLRESGLDPSAVRAIGSHGQTVWHDPAPPEPESVQLGSPALIAELTGIDTVGDFRRADLEAGGEGAPLAPLLHRALFRPDSGVRAVLNLGGIANISTLHSDGRVSGHDTGPANCLLDGWAQRHLHRPYDEAGAWASGGRVDRNLLESMLSDPYFHRPAPKSTGIEYFHAGWLNHHLNDRRIGAQDVQSTLAELTAITVANDIRSCGAGEVLVCGGGTHNTDLLGRLRACLPGMAVESTLAKGLDPDWVEAVLFAWLARERLADRAQDTRTITGARRPVYLGTVFRSA